MDGLEDLGIVRKYSNPGAGHGIGEMILIQKEQ